MMNAVTTHVYYAPETDTYTYCLYSQEARYQVAIAGAHHGSQQDLRWRRILHAMGWPVLALAAWERVFRRCCHHRHLPPDTVSVFTAAWVLGLSESEVYRKIRRGVLPALPGQGRDGRRLPREAVYDYQAQQRRRKEGHHAPAY